MLIPALVAMTSACALSLRSPSINDLQSHPGRYHDQTVSVSGIVTTSWGLPLVPFKFYKVDDITNILLDYYTKNILLYMRTFLD